MKKSTGDDDSGCVMDRRLNTIYLHGDITPKLATTFRRMLRALESGTRNIIVEINSPGGDIESGLMIIDSIDLCKRKVITRVTGAAYSMAAVILLAGHSREMFKNATIMVHQGSYSLKVPYDELHVEVAEIMRLEKVCWEIMDNRTGKEEGYWFSRCLGRNLYLTSDAALKDGLIDKICTRG